MEAGLLGRLAATMTSMIDRGARARQCRFVAYASHELRSPIAVIRLHTEVALDHPGYAGQLARTIHAESLRMQALVEDLLLLAQADEQSLLPRRRPVDLADLVRAEARRLRELDTVAVDASGVSAARVDGDPEMLRRVLRNLGDNAVRHARQRVRLAVSEPDGWAELHVDDDGPGVPVAERSRVFERFVRVGDAAGRAGGSGLGLAIVAEIVAAHGGTAALGDGPLGGARATVRLPRPGYT